MSKKPELGVGVIIENGLGQILVARRKGSHAPYWSIPGGSLDWGESFESAAIREVDEEHGITIHDPKVIAVTNNLETFARDGVHFASVILKAASFEGTPVIKEPHKCEAIAWVDPNNLPQPHFDASRLGVECWLKGLVYVGMIE